MAVYAVGDAGAVPVGQPGPPPRRPGPAAARSCRSPRSSSPDAAPILGLILMLGSSGDVSTTAKDCPSCSRPAVVGAAMNSGSACVTAPLRCDARGAAIACGSVMPKSMRFTRICSTVVMIDAPPGEPIASHGVPDLSTIVGDMLDRGRLPAAGRFGSGTPGRRGGQWNLVG